ncbi:ArsR/SmtB family transcription factor [Pelagibacterium halotolerans]|uniref:ArsR/SmtB family transcription factor n=1 Tax=Pelagibacterium halotolerans TaxID=531813 RepID=UPI00384F20F2
MAEPHIAEADISIIAETFRLLGDPTRLRILLVCLDGPRSVGEIAQTVDASQSLVSHHLRLLRAARLVVGTRKAKQVIYEAADEHIRHMLTDMIAHSAEEPDH